MGASQAAERTWAMASAYQRRAVAWTPYSRKAIAIADVRSAQRGAGLADVGRGVAAAVLIDVGYAPAGPGHGTRPTTP